MIKKEPENLIEDTIGTAAYLALCDWTGGVNYYVPSSPDCEQAQKLAQAIGDAPMRLLVQWAMGSVIYVPNRSAAELLKRQREILCMRSTGKTVQEIARTYKYNSRYTERQIWRMMTLPRSEIMAHGDELTLDLFKSA